MVDDVVRLNQGLMSLLLSKAHLHEHVDVFVELLLILRHLN